MARKVTISSLGQAPPRYPSEEKFSDYNALTDNMIAFWERQINAVLLDKPDVIVLPEMCERYNGVPQKEKLELRDAMGDRMVGVLQTIARENNCYIVHSSALPAADGTWRRTPTDPGPSAARELRG